MPQINPNDALGNAGAAAAHARFLATRHFGSLNGIRFLAIIAVMWHHSPASLTIGPVRGILGHGYAGVDLFFVLSGFLITTLLLREQDRKGRISLKGFYWRRALRILPIYLLLVTLVSIYYVLLRGQDIYAPYVPYYYLFLANFTLDHLPLLSVTWSLSVEEQYYMIWPALLVALPVLTRVRAGFLGVGILLMVGASTGLIPLPDAPSTQHAVFALPTVSYAAILMGSLLAVLIHDRRGFVLLWSLLGWRGAPLLCLVLMGFCLTQLPADLTGWPYVVLHLAMVALMASVVLREDHLVQPVMSTRLIARFGEISYGLYLYHLIALDVSWRLMRITGFEGPALPWLVTALFPVLSFIMAELSFRYIESRFLALKNRVAH